MSRSAIRPLRLTSLLTGWSGSRSNDRRSEKNRANGWRHCGTAYERCSDSGPVELHPFLRLNQRLNLSVLIVRPVGEMITLQPLIILFVLRLVMYFRHLRSSLACGFFRRSDDRLGRRRRPGPSVSTTSPRRNEHFHLSVASSTVLLIEMMAVFLTSLPVLRRSHRAG